MPIAPIQRALDQNGNLSHAGSPSAKKLSPGDLRDAELPFVYDDNQTLVFVDVPSAAASPSGWKVQVQSVSGAGGVHRFFLERVYLGKCVQLTVLARKIDVEALLCKKIVLRPEKLATNQFQPHPPAFPVLSEGIELFAACTPTAQPTVANLGGVQSVTYSLLLSDGRTFLHSFPVDQGAVPDVAIWPDFKSPAWKCYQLLFAARGAQQVIDPGWTAKFLWRDGGAAAKASRAGSLVTETESVPDRVEVISPLGEARGVFDLQSQSLVNVTPAAEVLQVALDFGTANTCISFPDPATNRAVTIPFTREWVPLLPGSDASRDPRWTRLVGTREVPSELIVLDSTSETTIKNSLSDAGCRFIPHPDQANAQDIKNERVLSGFKWADARRMPSVVSPLNLPGFVGEAARSYLRDLLLRACAELLPNANHLSLRVSYPQAFSSSAVLAYEMRLTQVITDIMRETGMTLAIEGFANESLAAVHSAIGTNPVDYCLLIDVGGGTTDYAVTERLLPDPATGGYAPANPANVSSLRMAGFDLAEAIIEPLLLPGAPQKERTQQLLELTRKIRTWRNQQSIQELLGERPLLTNKARIAAAVNDGFLGLCYMGAVLLASRLSRDLKSGAISKDRDCDVTIVLSGNGWSLSAFGLATPNFAAWVGGQVAAEKSFAEGVFLAVWGPMEAALGIPAGKVHFTFMRPLGKAGTSQGLFTTRVVNPRNAAMELPLEPMGVELVQSLATATSPIDPTAIIPYAIPSGGSISFAGFWLMPPALEARLEKAAAQGMTLVQHINQAYMSTVHTSSAFNFTNHPPIGPGNYVWNMPLKVILEQMLPLALRMP